MGLLVEAGEGYRAQPNMDVPNYRNTREGTAALPYTEIAESGINVFIENRSSVGVCYQNPTSRISIAHRNQNLGVGAGCHARPR